MVDWYPDSKSILYKSEMLSFVRRFNRFFKISINGGLPQTLPLPYGEHASFGSDANTLYFQDITREDRNWKRYMGGMASDIWEYNFISDSANKITSYEGSDSLPMWNKEYLYYMSDRGDNRRNNIWKLDMESGVSSQVTFFDTFDVKWPSYGDGYIVFENGGILYTLNTTDDKLAELKITVSDDLPDIRPQIKNLSNYITNYNISPDGNHAIFEARGEIFIYDIKNKFAKNITNSSGSAERYPSWSHDSKRIAYFSDESGEYNLTVLDLGKGIKDTIKLEKGYYYNTKWSPDGKNILFSNNTGSLYNANIEKHLVSKIDKDNWVPLDRYSWSPDSRWVAYSKKLDNYQSSIFIYDLKNKKNHRITNEFYNDTIPVFGDDGEYLAFYSDRYFKPIYSDFEDTWIYPNSTELFLITLNKDKRSPFLPVNHNQVKKGNKNDKQFHNKNSNQVKIDFEDIDSRVIKVPVSAGNYSELRFIGGKIYYLRKNDTGEHDSNNKGNLNYFDLQDRKENNLIKDINGFDISSDGSKYIYKSGKKYGVLTTEKEGKVGEGALDLKKISGLVDYRKEWTQIFNEAWRIERDFFYDPNMHGNNWQHIRDKYEKLLKHVVSRRDLNYVIGEMIGELNSSHTYVRKGDFNEQIEIGVGLLGCDFGYDNQNEAIYFKKIYGDVNIQSFAESPLLTTGLNIKEGDYLLKVNGKTLDTSIDPLSAFQGLDNQVVELTIGNKSDINDARVILVNTIDRNTDLKLRYYSWVENNRKYVNDLSNHKIGYIYIPDTSVWGQDELVRQFMPQKNKQGLIIDERFNSGGQIPDRFIELLNRPVYNYWARREQNYLKTPFSSHSGPKVMIINGWSGSGGDALPYYFKKAGLGKIVGMRTLGALIGIGEYPKLVDGGYVTAPAYAFFNTHGNWGIEGYGVNPDYQIQNISNEKPGESDPQLDKAIKVITDELDNIKQDNIMIPKYPDKSGNN